LHDQKRSLNNTSLKSLYIHLLTIIIAVAMIFLPSCTALRRPEGNEEYRYPGTQPPKHSEAPRPTRDPSLSGAIARAVEKVRPSVVGISTTHVQQESFTGERQTVEGVGSGFIVSEDGYILTNDHVAGGGAEKIVVILHNGDELEGRTLWTDPTLDLAIVKVNAANLPAAELGDSRQLAAGDPAIAIGTPLGLQFQQTTTAGIISALDRTVEVPTQRGQNFMEDLIQTDASINPGNSGGPLVNINGQIIGINTVKVTSAEGIGFAIPIEVAKPVIQHFMEDGEFTTPYIGIVGYDKSIAHYYKQNDNLADGVYVVNLDPKGPAYKSGIRVDDIITEVDNKPVTKMLELRTAVYSNHIGDTIKVIVDRDGRQLEFHMVLEKSPVSAAS
jgi:serine protease Do